MSHSTVTVILPLDTDIESYGAVQAKVEELLAPFDENMEVEEYDRKCYCVGSAAGAAAREVADTLVGNLDTFRDQLRAELPFPGYSDTEEGQAAYAAWDKATDARWKELIKPYKEAEAAALAANPDRDAPDPTCDSCKGTGLYKSTYNPKSRWDWYQIGGGWAGKFSAASSARYGGNVARVGDLTEEMKTFALLTPFGEWVERGHMGWWGMVSDEDDTYAQKWKMVLSEYIEAWCVVVDVHI